MKKLKDDTTYSLCELKDITYLYVAKKALHIVDLDISDAEYLNLIYSMLDKLTKYDKFGTDILSVYSISNTILSISNIFKDCNNNIELIKEVDLLKYFSLAELPKNVLDIAYGYVETHPITIDNSYDNKKYLIDIVKEASNKYDFIDNIYDSIYDWCHNDDVDTEYLEDDTIDYVKNNVDLYYDWYDDLIKQLISESYSLIPEYTFLDTYITVDITFRFNEINAYEKFIRFICTNQNFNIDSDQRLSKILNCIVNKTINANMDRDIKILKIKYSTNSFVRSIINEMQYVYVEYVDDRYIQDEYTNNEYDNSHYNYSNNNNNSPDNYLSCSATVYLTIERYYEILEAINNNGKYIGKVETDSANTIIYHTYSDVSTDCSSSIELTNCIFKNTLNITKITVE